MNNITLKQLSINHDYYASDSNYYSFDAGASFNTWNEFFAEFKDADVDMNLVYRWDIILDEEDNKTYKMQIIIIGQRKGLYLPMQIKSVTEEDVPSIIEFLKPHFDKLIKIWNPLNYLFLNNV